MEPRSVVARYDASRNTFTVHTGGQSAHSIRTVMSMVLNHPAEDIRVVIPDTGGGFGARNSVYPEFVLTALTARKRGKPVRF